METNNLGPRPPNDGVHHPSYSSFTADAVHRSREEDAVVGDDDDDRAEDDGTGAESSVAGSTTTTTTVTTPLFAVTGRSSSGRTSISFDDLTYSTGSSEAAADASMASSGERLAQQRHHQFSALQLLSSHRHPHQQGGTQHLRHPPSPSPYQQYYQHHYDDDPYFSQPVRPGDPYPGFANAVQESSHFSGGNNSSNNNARRSGSVPVVVGRLLNQFLPSRIAAAAAPTQQQHDRHHHPDPYLHHHHDGLAPSSGAAPSSGMTSAVGSSTTIYHPRNNTNPRQHGSSSLGRCLISPRVIFTVAVCVVVAGNLLVGSQFFEHVFELGLSGLRAQHLANQAQTKLFKKFKPSKEAPLPVAIPLKPLKEGSTKTTATKDPSGAAAAAKGGDNGNGGGGGVAGGATNSSISSSSSPAPGCEASVMILRHCEKGDLKSHCNYLGYERSVYLSTLFGNEPSDRWPAPSKIYALSKGGRKHKKFNLRELETVEALAAKHHLTVNNDYTILTTKPLAAHLLTKVVDGEQCGKLMVVSWKHSDIPRLAQHLGCGPIEGCPLDYKGKDFDSVWLIRYVFADFHTTRDGPPKEKWNVFGSVQPEGFDPLAFSKLVGDYPPGGKTESSGIATWSEAMKVFYG
jgi:hypothetical protein